MEHRTHRTNGTNGGALRTTRPTQFGKYDRAQWRTQATLRPAVVRLAAICKRIERGDFVSAGEMAEELGVRRMTLVRDIRALKAMGHQVEYDVHRKGWFYRERPEKDGLVVREQQARADLVLLPGREAAKRRRVTGQAVRELLEAAEAVHVARGAVAPEDTKSIEFWETAYAANAAAAEEQLKKLPGRAMARVIRGAGDNRTTTAGNEPEEVFMAKAKAFGEANKITGGPAEVMSAYARSAEGKVLYEEFRKKIVQK